MCSWNPVEKILASGSADGVCRLWGLTDMDQSKWDDNSLNTNLRSALLMHTMYPLERFKDVTSVTWSRDGKMLATGCYDGLARVWDRQGEQKVLLNEHTGPVFSLKWNKTGNYLLSGSYDRRAVVWDPKTGGHRHREVIEKLAFRKRERLTRWACSACPAEGRRPTSRWDSSFKRPTRAAATPGTRRAA